MSGVEAIGLLLGVLPLLISAVEHYDDVLRPIRRYRAFSSKSQRFSDELVTEQAVFQAECQLLLGEFVGLDNAQEMLSDAKHPSWKNETLCKRFERQLGNLGPICLSNISMIDSKLKEIGETFKDFLPASPPSPDTTQAAYRAWLSGRKRKLKFAFSEGTLRTCIGDLRGQNEVFRVISSQIVRLDRQQQLQNDQRRIDLSFRKRCSLDQIMKIRHASLRLYDALCMACPTHDTHLVKFCLETTYDKGGIQTGSAQICFNLAYAPLLAIQLVAASQTHPPYQITDSAQTQTENRSTKPPEIPDSESIMDAKWVEVESVLDSESTLDAASSHIEPSQPNDFCKKLQTSIAQPVPTATKNLIFTLNRHRIYYPSPQMPPTPPTAFTSLTDLLSATKIPSISNVPQLHRLRIAKSFATALLKFYRTPWLPESLESKNLLINTISPNNWQSYSPSPHLIVRVNPLSSPPNPLTPTNTPPPPPPATNITVPSRPLFSLGITLLELAYGAPFHTLSQQPHLTLQPLMDPKMAEFNAAYHLANNVGMYFGASYAEVVRKCLRCDFGAGDDLESERLQEGVFEDVVCRLEGLVEGVWRAQGG